MKRALPPAAGFALLALPVVLLAADAPRVNLLFITTDQQRWDAMSCPGNPVLKTPNLDRLAQQGARFTRFYSVSPARVPARTAMFLGHSIEANQVLRSADGPCGLSAEVSAGLYRSASVMSHKYLDLYRGSGTLPPCRDTHRR